MTYQHASKLLAACCPQPLFVLARQKSFVPKAVSSEVIASGAPAPCNLFECVPARAEDHLSDEVDAWFQGATSTKCPRFIVAPPDDKLPPF